MATRISRTVLHNISAEAAADPHREICGLLLAEGGEITACRAANNVAPDPARHFEIDPAQLIAAHRAARQGGPAIAGYYHSHPSGGATPSITDARDAAPDGLLWLIVGDGQVSAWRTGQDGLHGRFMAESLTLFDDAALASTAANGQ